MTLSVSDGNTKPVVIPSGKTATPFGAVSVNESTLTATDNLTVALSLLPFSTDSGLGALSDPTGGGLFNASTGVFTESSVATGTPSNATAILRRLIYTPPTPTVGNYAAVNATISVNNGTLAASGPKPVVLETVTAPAITKTIAKEPVASGASLHPFASTRITDLNIGYNAQDAATIILTDGSATPTDADGILTGTGLSKSGVGTYTMAATDAYQLQGYLQGLVFTTTAVPTGAERTTGFNLAVVNTETALASTNDTTSVLTIGPAVTPVPPLISGTSGDQTVAPGNAIVPFNGVTISDNNVNPLDSATLTVSGGGTLSGVGLIAGAPGVYTIAATSPAALTSILGKLTFSAPPLAGQASNTSTIKLDIVDGQQIASDSKTTIKEAVVVTPQPPIGSGTGNNFSIADQTTGQQYFRGGEKYSGPVPGIDQQLILLSPNNLNISATVPNTFIHSGAGVDAIDVSRVNGNNTLDGSTGSNFLVGGTGLDTFFLDDRNPTSDVFSTVVNFHAGDNITIFGVNPTDFKVVTQDNQGAVNAKGLTYTFTAAGRPNASIVIAGFSSADLANGRLTTGYGRTNDGPGQPGSEFLNIHGN